VSRTTTVIIGGGQAGLAMSYCLSELGIDHVVLERSEVADRWRTHGWDSLQLLTPNWMTRLPGYRYDGSDPDGFMRAPEVVSFLQRYAQVARAPIQTHTEVQHVDRHGEGFRVLTSRGMWRAASVVVATGYCDVSAVPSQHRLLRPSIDQLVPRDYRRPGQLAPGGVLVVGASATGVQLADEIQRSGRQVTLAVGQHTRLPRRYRGHDILWWLDRLGVLGQHASRVHNVETSRQQPSLQLVGRDDHATLDLNVLRGRGVRIVGRLLEAGRERLRFSEHLFATTAAADYKLAGVLQRIDAFIKELGIAAPPQPPFDPCWPHLRDSQTIVNLRSDRIKTVIWATGYRRDYRWLRLPVFTALGEIIHWGGVTPLPGLYVLGLNFLRRRNSSFIDGVGADARELAAHLARQLPIPRIA
jgi:putative flavoprotein involved in K+ transport